MSCECGCKKQPKGGDFMPGHDQKLRAWIEGTLSDLAGSKRRGLLVARDVVDALEALKEGRITDAAFLDRVRKL